MPTRPTTTIRLTEEDRHILGELQAMTGLDSFASVIRFCIREELARRKKKR